MSYWNVFVHFGFVFRYSPRMVGDERFMWRQNIKSTENKQKMMTNEDNNGEEKGMKS